MVTSTPMELLVVGLDGLSFNMLERFDIQLPYLESIRESGISGDLMSVDTPTTLPAWTSFQTGQDPGSHGVSNMIQQSADYRTYPARGVETVPAAYDFLSDGMFVNLPGSVRRRPAAENTHLVSAMLAEDEADAVPPHLQELDAYEGYILDHDKGIKRDPDRYFEHVEEITRRRRDFALEAFETYEPRVGFVLFSTPDWAGHLLSNFSDDETRSSYYGPLLEVVDECTADLAELAENVLLMSDHGFEAKDTNIHVNEWLSDEGYLTTGSTTASPERAVFRIGSFIGRRSDRLYEAMRRVYNAILGTDVGQRLANAAEPAVEYEQSQAWQLRYGCVYLNDERFESPTVSAEDRSQLRTEIRNGLRELTDDDGRRLFRDVLFPAEAYADPGPDAPDVIARPAEGCYPTLLDSPTGDWHTPTNNFNHRYKGILAAAGPAFTQGRVEGASIIDILPTMMHLLGEPLSPEFDGQVRTEMLSIDREPVTLDPSESSSPVLRQEEDRQAERDTVVEDRLEDLGYLE